MNTEITADPAAGISSHLPAALNGQNGFSHA
jgi:hypothetical protein